MMNEGQQSEKRGEGEAGAVSAKTTNGESVYGNFMNKWSVPFSIIIAGAIIGLAVIYSGGVGGQPEKDLAAVKTDNKPGGGGQPAAAVDPKKLFSDSDRFQGDPEAKVVLVEFADFQCPFCGKFFRETAPQIMEKYVKTGKARFVYKHFAFLGEESRWAAEASECAGDQGKFWQYHDYLYNHLWNNYYAKGQNGENVGAFSQENLKKFAKTLEFNAGEFSKCLDSGKYKQKVMNDTEIGRQNGVSGTPSVFVNGEILVGAQPFSAFQTAIDEALK